MGVFEEFVKAVRHPKKLVTRLYSNPRELYWRSTHALRGDLLRAFAVYKRSIHGQTGISFINRDWDTLVILDACRYDLFTEVNTLPGSLERVLSNGTATVEFLEKNFAGKQFPETVYLTANPNSHHVDAEFHAVLPLWDDHWDDELKTVTPDVVAEKAIEAHREYPHKRLIVHFIQPHYPFIGETGRKIEQGGFTGRGVIADHREALTIWEQIHRGQVDEKTAWRAYRENLELTLPHVESILDAVDGKTVVTSDHANAFGELGEYGHRSGIYLESVLAVPWLEIEGESRRDITSGSVEDTAGDDDVLEDRLAALGYK